MRLAILSDIHANYTALCAVLADLEKSSRYDFVALLGDIINYGPRPNEVLKRVKGIENKIIVNLWGNHELALSGKGMERFSTMRGRRVPEYTKRMLTAENMRYIETEMNREGCEKLTLDGKRFLFLHGTMEDRYWGKMIPEEFAKTEYGDYDYVVSGHTHIPMYFEHFLPSDNAVYRNRKRTVFINPGSVGQPRNHNPLAQYGILDTITEEYEHRCVEYDVAAEQQLFDTRSIDIFYKERLKNGI